MNIRAPCRLHAARPLQRGGNDRSRHDDDRHLPGRSGGRRGYGGYRRGPRGRWFDEIRCYQHDPFYAVQGLGIGPRCRRRPPVASVWPSSISTPVSTSSVRMPGLGNPRTVAV